MLRRQFLAAGSVLSLSAAVPAFWLRAAEAADDAKNPKNGRVLVMLQMSGGNDGLNTVVPFGDDLYYKNRFTLAIGKGSALKIDNYCGFHPNLRGFADLLAEGRLAVVNGVGYPQPNRSHFESMDIWHTCRREVAARQEGWLGRYLDATSGRGGDVPALHLGGDKLPLALAALQTSVPSARSLTQFHLEAAKDGHLAKAIETGVSAKRGGDNDLLTFVQQGAQSALASSRRVGEVLGKYKTDVNYPGTGLAQQLKTVAQLIDAGLSTQVYYLTLGGFDTHSNQAPAHAGLMEEMGGAVAAFVDDLHRHGHGERVTLAAFSEFGRRVKENASGGTDHGAAAPMFLAGGAVKPGLHGKYPSLSDLDDGDLIHHTDFRKIYATLLDRWLGWSSEAILGGKYEPMGLVG
jgi:uncharacterized protein (DUF1501 family)